MVTVGLGYFAAQVKINTANEYFFLPDDEFLRRYTDYKQTFGTDEFVYVLFTSEDVFTRDTLLKLDRFKARALKEVPHVLRIRSIVDVESIVSEDDSIIVRPFMGADGIPESAEALAALKARALANELYTSSFVSPDARHAGILIETEVVEGDGVYRKTITDKVRGLADDPEFAAYAPHVVGPPIMDADVDRVLVYESKLFGMCAFGIFFIILVWTFRRTVDVLAPLIVVGVTDVWVIGLMALFDVPMTMMSIVLPGVVTVVGCGDAIHVISEYRTRLAHSGDVNVAIRETVSVTGLPCLFTSLTTMVGFGSLMAMELRPGREMGLFAAIGVAIAFAITFLLLPPILSFGAAPAPASAAGSTPETGGWSVRLLEAVGRLAERRAGIIVALGALLFAGGIAGLMRVEVSADFLRLFSESTRLRRDYDFVDKNLGGTGSLEIVLDTRKTDGAFEPEFLADLSRLDDWLKAQPILRSTNSVLDVLQELNQVAHGGDVAFARPPETRAEATQLFLLYEMGGADSVDRMITPERDRVHVAVRTESVSSQDFEALLHALDKWSADNIKSAKVEATGMAPLFVRMVHTITRSQVASFSLAFGAVLLMFLILFRSIGLGLLAMVPNVVPIAITFGFMGFSGITLNIATVMIASIAIGIAVDDSIHFVAHFRHHRHAGLCIPEAVRLTLTGVGRALTTTSIVLAMGFSVFGLSDIAHLVNFGLLTALTVTTALAADLLLLPALLLLFHRARAAAP